MWRGSVGCFGWCSVGVFVLLGVVGAESVHLGV